MAATAAVKHLLNSLSRSNTFSVLMYDLLVYKTQGTPTKRKVALVDRTTGLAVANRNYYTHTYKKANMLWSFACKRARIIDFLYIFHHSPRISPTGAMIFLHIRRLDLLVNSTQLHIWAWFMATLCIIGKGAMGAFNVLSQFQ